MDAIRLSPPRRLKLPVANRWGAGEMAVLDFGDPERPVDLVFIHANGFNALTYRTLLAPLAGSIRIWAPDLRGHGATALPVDPTARRSWNDHRDDAVALLDSLDGPPVVLAGHSMGGTTALLAAAERPDRVSNLVLLDPVIWSPLWAALLRLPLIDRLPGRSPLVRNALRRRDRFESREQAMAGYLGRGAFPGLARDDAGRLSRRWPGRGRRGLLPGLRPGLGSLQLRRPGARQLARAQGVDRPVRILKAATGSPCHIPDAPRGLPHVSVGTVADGTHFFPMLKTDVARDALFDAAV